MSKRTSKELDRYIEDTNRELEDVYAKEFVVNVFGNDITVRVFGDETTSKVTMLFKYMGRMYAFDVTPLAAGVEKEIFHDGCIDILMYLIKLQSILQCEIMNYALWYRTKSVPVVRLGAFKLNYDASIMRLTCDNIVDTNFVGKMQYEVITRL